jgi:hypothetical protein
MILKIARRLTRHKTSPAFLIRWWVAVPSPRAQLAQEHFSSSLNPSSRDIHLKRKNETMTQC